MHGKKTFNEKLHSLLFYLLSLNFETQVGLAEFEPSPSFSTMISITYKNKIINDIIQFQSQGQMVHWAILFLLPIRLASGQHQNVKDL